ncbi:WecB/TagA/CpsF family glycosyltransferase [Rhabdobacter roseus]|uniref:N-acetylglucosaminyldiphosphoundecaprenol N-acetyl-beta-D-mannosaminyltransferase n=1 Tax=Rhabdobacter roseus TaxID=1655419 RepID=A0A840TUV4_9BACT|nr:WecB/TagA/CpsF family glycosyltransferase [Rhabdobacter roseus]MBB5286685.1 N-acetylglucosaminyldiphosphoundecaprenol N-acetyl-beta-D-mannosaminyltransferase [Rhabdobacter roseus]
MKKLFSFFPMTVGTYDSFVSKVVDLGMKKRSSYVCVANVHMMGEAKKDPSYAKIINEADLVTPDGMPLVLAMRWLYNVPQERVAGCDLFPSLLNEAAKKNLNVFFLGSTQDVLNKLEDKCIRNIPKLKIAGKYSPPFRQATEDEQKALIKIINDSNSHIIFVALGCPKQEKWMASMKGKIQGVMIGVGNAFPVYAGIEKLAPQWMRRLSLEWVYRFAQDPQRLWKRYIVNNSMFIWWFSIEWFRLRLTFKKIKYS